MDHPTHTYLAGRECVPTHNTTLALHALASAQKAGGIAAFIDAEHALDPDYAKKLGVDTDALLVSQPDTGEQALEIADMLIRSGAIDVVVIDSVAALVPRAEIEGEMGDSHVGLQARLMSQALRKITGALSQTKTTAIFINQLREKVGVMFGSPETTSGGRALKFYASVRLDVRRIETLKDGTEAVGSRTRIKVVKNKCSPPFKVAECDIIFGTGISREGGLIDLGVEQSIVRKSGAWYTYEGDQLGQGKENSRNFLRDNPDLANEIEKKIKEKLGVGPRVDAEAAPAAGAGANGSAANGSPANGSAAGGPVAGAPGGPGGGGPCGHGPGRGRAGWRERRCLTGRGQAARGVPARPAGPGRIRTGAARPGEADDGRRHGPRRAGPAALPAAAHRAAADPGPARGGHAPPRRARGRGRRGPGPLHRGGPDRRRGLRPRVGRVAASRPGAGPAGALGRAQAARRGRRRTSARR